MELNYFSSFLCVFDKNYFWVIISAAKGGKNMIKSEKKQTLKKLKSMLVLVSILSCSACKDEIKEEFLNPGTTETYVDGWRVKSYEELKERLGDAKLDENCPFKSRIIVIQKVKNNSSNFLIRFN